jgi:hypothetical protein
MTDESAARACSIFSMRSIVQAKLPFRICSRKLSPPWKYALASWSTVRPLRSLPLTALTNLSTSSPGALFTRVNWRTVYMNDLAGKRPENTSFFNVGLISVSNPRRTLTQAGLRSS